MYFVQSGFGRSVKTVIAKMFRGKKKKIIMSSNTLQYSCTQTSHTYFSRVSCCVLCCVCFGPEG